MAIQTIGGVVAGDSSKEDGGTIKAAFNVSKTKVRFPVVGFAPGRYIITAIGSGTPAVSVYTGTAVTGLPAFIKGQDGTGALVFDLSSAQDGLLVQNFEGAITLKTWAETAQIATVSRPGETWTYEGQNNFATQPGQFEPCLPVVANGVIMVSAVNTNVRHVFISQDNGATWRSILLPQQHRFPNHGAFLYDTNLQEWWISPRDTNFWYKTTHAALINANNNGVVPWTRMQKMRDANSLAGRVRGGNTGTPLGGVWTGLNQPSPHRGGADYDQIYRITNDIWFSNLRSQDILRTGDGGVTWQEFRVTATPVAPNTSQPDGYFDFGVNTGSELFMAVRDNNNGQIVRITDALNVNGPTIACIDIADTTFWGAASNSSFTVFFHNGGMYRLNNSSTTIVNLSGNSYDGSRRWRGVWTGSKWVFMDRENRSDYFIVHNNDPHVVTAYNVSTNPTGRESLSMRTYANENWHTLRGNTSNETETLNSGVPLSWRAGALIMAPAQGGNPARLVAIPHNGNWHENARDQIFPIMLSTTDGASGGWTFIMNPLGAIAEGFYGAGIGGTTGQVRWVLSRHDANVDNGATISFNGGRNWYSVHQIIQHQALTSSQWRFLWRKTDDQRARTAGNGHHSVAADASGRVVIAYQNNDRFALLYSKDNGTTWVMYNHSDGYSASLIGNTDSNRLNPYIRQALITPDGRWYGGHDGQVYTFKADNFADIQYLNELNGRLDEVGGSEGDFAYGDGKVILMRELSEVFATFDNDAGNLTPQVQEHPAFDLTINGLAYGNGTWVAVGRTGTFNGVNYRNQTYLYSTNNGASWTAAAQPWRTRGNDRVEWENALVFTGSYFFYKGFGMKQGFRSADGVNWEPWNVPYDVRTSEALWNGNSLWDEENRWNNNEQGHLHVYGNKLYYFNQSGQFYTSNTTAQLTA